MAFHNLESRPLGRDFIDPWNSCWADPKGDIVYPIIYRVLHIPGGWEWDVLPSTV